MAPDADKLRQRKAQQVQDAQDASATTEKISSIKALGNTEIVIDGVIYDIADFNHPGGESVLLFGGRLFKPL